MRDTTFAGLLVFFCFVAGVAVLFLIYGPVLDAPFVFDSATSIVEGKHRFAETPLFSGPRWLMEFSFALHQEIFGNAPFWFRLPNLVLHALNGFLIAVLACGILRGGKSSVSLVTASLLSCATALLFLWHPITTYAVAYAIQRSILLASFFCLLAMIFWWRGLVICRERWFYVAVLCYYLAYSSKEHVILLPAVLGLMTLLRRPWRETILSGIVPPLLFMGLMAAYWLLNARGILGQVYEPFANIVLSEAKDSSLALAREDLYPISIMLQGSLFFRYILLWLLPVGRWLAIDLPQPFPETFPAWPEILGLVLYVLLPFILFFLAWKKTKWRPIFLWLLIPWMMFGTEFAAVRLHENFVLYRSYLWAALAFPVLPLCLSGWRLRSVFPVLALVAVLLGLELKDRVLTFASPLSVWEDAALKLDRSLPVERLPQANRVLSNYGKYLAEAGRYTEALKSYQDAILYLPNHYKAHCGAGAALALLKRHREALETFTKCRDLNPGYAQAYYNLGNIQAILHDETSAEENFKKAIALAPNDMADAYFNLGNLYLRQGQFKEAENIYRGYVNLRPKDPDIYNNLGFALYKQGHVAEAQAMYEKMMALDPKRAPKAPAATLTNPLK